MASSRTPLFVILPALSIAACSLFTSLDGLNDGDDAGSALDASSDVVSADVVDAGTDAIALTDAPSGLLACDAADLVAYWPLDEGSGSTVHDCHQGLDGTFGGDAGTPTWGTRGSSTDLEFTGDSYVTFGTQARLQLAGPFTVSGWFRPDNDPTDDTSLFWNYNGGGLQGFEITLNAVNNFYAQVGDGLQSTSVPFNVPALGDWVHVALVYEPGVRFETFVNGSSVGKTTVNSGDGGALPGAAPCPHEARLGSNYPTTRWSGGIDDVRIFSRALSATEIAQLAAK